MRAPRGCFRFLVFFSSLLVTSPAYAGINSVVYEGYYATESQYRGMDPNDTFRVTLVGGTAATNDAITRDDQVIVEWLDANGNVIATSGPLDLKNVVVVADGTIDRLVFSDNFLEDTFGLQGSGQSTLTEVPPPAQHP